MPGRPAVRLNDLVTHLIPPQLSSGTGSPNVLIGGMPAWRGVPRATAETLQSAKKVSDKAIEVAELNRKAAAGTPGWSAAKAAENIVKQKAADAMTSMITSMAGGADRHVCFVPLPLPPHGPGVVIDGSQTVLINGLQACRLGDTILEAVGPPNKIVSGQMTVLIED